MEIHARCKCDYACIKEMAHATMYRYFNPSSVLVSTFILSGMFLSLQLCDIIIYGIEENTLLFMTYPFILSGITAYFYWGIPKLQYKSMGKFQGVENEYVFEDESFKTITKSESYNAEGEIQYSLIPRVIETSKYMYVYQNNHQAYAIDKSTITNGTVEELRDKLKQYVPKKKYNICRY